MKWFRSMCSTALLWSVVAVLAGCGSVEEDYETKPEDDPALSSEEMDSMTSEGSPE